MAGKKATLHKIHCNYCRRETAHRLLRTLKGDHGSQTYDSNFSIWWETTFELFQCCGCSEALLRRTSDHSEFEEPDVRYFPPRVSRHLPAWSYDLPYDLKFVLDEVYRSLDANNRRLPMMGARTLLDMAIVEKVKDRGSFAAKLRALEDEGFVSSKNREVLEAAFDAGSAAVHRGYAPKREHVNAVMDIVENVLQSMYVLQEAALELKKSTPQRKKTSP